MFGHEREKLSGTWYNELGSVMEIKADGHGGITGTYNSKVGDATNFYDLTGRFDSAPPHGEGTSVGWARILTHWLLTSSTKPPDVWSSTNIGNDTFTRKKPSAADIEHARAMKICSPHPEDIIATLSARRA
ncbi:chaperoned ruthenium Metallodrugs that recognize Telomeric Dna [Mycena pura]|uniref:Chaperoned ruthenium Metallodrugs that recognize Telomeric Dna n=1 Tax=Mycena pura TaxID=153505 RepID=A0AAD7E370_9AGAR|nr:chaperoned ruthenium Metallodrugs that recognize Telomeric Dna [Mycena pura]